MLLTKEGQSAVFDGRTFTVGMPVKAIDSYYKGLYGRITIADGEDKETDNETPDIYCEFYEPENQQSRLELEQYFTMLDGTPRRIEDIALDSVIMAPHMLQAAEMRLFNVEITETLQTQVQIEAYFAPDAEQIAEDQWKDGIYILGAEDFVDVSFKAAEAEPLIAVAETDIENEEEMEV